MSKNHGNCFPTLVLLKSNHRTALRWNLTWTYLGYLGNKLRKGFIFSKEGSCDIENWYDIF